MADSGWWRRTWTWLEPWLEHLVWMHPDVAGAYLGWRLMPGAAHSSHAEVLKVA